MTLLEKLLNGKRVFLETGFGTDLPYTSKLISYSGVLNIPHNV